jgi:hypothetical protein
VSSGWGLTQGIPLRGSPGGVFRTVFPGGGPMEGLPWRESTSCGSLQGVTWRGSIRGIQ